MHRITLDSIAYFSMLALCALLPFFFVPLDFVTVPQSKVMLVVVLLLVAGMAWSLAWFRAGIARVPKSSVVIAALLLPVAYFISTVVAGFASISLVGSGVEQDTLVASVLACGALVLAALIFAERPERVFAALRAFALGSLALICIQVIHLVFPALPLSAAFGGQAGNAFGNWHELGLLVGLCAYLGLAFFEFSPGERYWRFVFLALFILSALFLIVIDLSDVWTAVAALAFIMLAYQLYYRRAYERWALKVWGPWLAFGVVSLYFALFGAAVWNVLPAPLQVTNIDVQPSWQGTLGVGEQVLRTPHALLFGAGPNTFAREWSLYKPAAVNQTQFWNTDFDAGIGSVPTSLITVGLIGFLAWLAFIVALLWAVASYVIKGRHARGSSALFATGLGVLYLMMFHILYAPQAAFSVLTFLFAGIFIAQAITAGHVRTATVRFSAGGRTGYLWAAALIVCGLALVVAGSFALRVNLAETLVNRSVLLYSSSQDIGKATSLVQKALFVYPNDSRAHRAGVELGILELQRLAVASDSTSEIARAQLRNTLQDTIQHGLAAVSIDGSDYQNWLELASLYQNLAGANVQGAYESAQEAYQKALARDPTDPMLYFRLAQLDLLGKKPDTALADAQSALRLKPDFAAAYYLVSQVYTSKSDLADAALAAAKAVQYAPDDQLGWYNAGVIAYAQGDWQNASTDEEQALARDPHYANALYVLGLSYYQLQRPADSLATFQALDRLDPGQQAIGQILTNLAAGKAPLPTAPSVPAKGVKKGK